MKTFNVAPLKCLYKTLHTNSAPSNLFDPTGRSRHNHEAAGRTSN